MGNSFALNWQDIDYMDVVMRQAREGMSFIESNGYPCVSCRMINLIRVQLGASIVALAKAPAKNREIIVEPLSIGLALIVDLIDEIGAEEPYPCFWHHVRAGVEEAVDLLANVGSGSSVTNKVVLQCLTMAHRSYPELAYVFLSETHDAASLEEFRFTLSDVQNLYLDTSSAARFTARAGAMAFAA